MSKPPDITTNNYPALQFDHTKTINYVSNGPVFLLMSRISSNAETLANVSPFLIKKAIDNACSGEVEDCKKTRGGELLIKAKNSTQASKLIKLTALSNTIIVEVTLHKTLNFAKGVIYCNDLRGLPEDEILHELKSQNICEIRKIMKKQNEVLTETGLIILTFSSINTPLNINVGYQKIPVRPYIPPPMRCKNCFRYNHTAKHCRNAKSCYNCSNLYHLVDENDTCVLPKKCSNCVSHDIPQHNHSPIDKQCPIFIKETELQAIKITYKVDNSAARLIYNERHQHETTPYSHIVSQSNTSTNSHSRSNSTINKTPASPSLAKPTTSTDSTPSTSRVLHSYSDLLDDPKQTPATNLSEKLKEKKVKILPRNTPKRLVTRLKKSNNLAAASTSTPLTARLDSSDDGNMDTSDIKSQ